MECFTLWTILNEISFLIAKHMRSYFNDIISMTSSSMTSSPAPAVEIDFNLNMETLLSLHCQVVSKLYF